MMGNCREAALPEPIESLVEAVGDLDAMLAPPAVAPFGRPQPQRGVQAHRGDLARPRGPTGGPRDTPRSAGVSPSVRPGRPPCSPPGGARASLIALGSP